MEPAASAADFVAPTAKPTMAARVALPCPFSAQGMLQPSSVQPPPMFGPRGATIPPRHLNEYRGAGGGRGGGGRGGGHRDGFQPRNGHMHRPRFQNQRPPHNGDRRQQAPPAPYARPHQLTASAATTTAALVDTTTRTFCCEPCDRSFATADELHGHRAQHQRCTAVDGCPFEGHAQLVAAHVQQQHSSGLYERIRSVTTPEEIARWRDERRRKYPSAQNVELRQQIQAAKQQRGERLEPANSRFGAKTDRRQPALLQEKQQQSDQKRCDRNQTKPEDAKHDGSKPKRGRKKQKKPKSTLSAVEATANTGDLPDADQMNGTLQMFRGTATMKQYKRPRVKVVNALSGLLGAYDSDDDDDDVDGESDTESEEGAGKVGPIVHVNVKAGVESSGPVEPHQIADTLEQVAIIEERITNVEEDPDETPAIIVEPIHDYDAEDADPDNGPPDEDVVQRTSTLPDLPADVPVTAVAPTTTAEPKGTRKRPAQSAHVQNAVAVAKRAKPTTSLDLSRRYRNQNTMLEKLLQKDIRHERNVLLQCVRYVVAQKFFGVGQRQEHKENDQK